MNALFDEQNMGVAYASDAIVPENKFDVATIHHESILLDNARVVIEKIGGKTMGEKATHEDGRTIDIQQFELEDKEDIYV